MLCPICKKEIQDNINFCGFCGQKIPRCPTCGKVISKPSRFCINDGTPLPEEMFAYQQEENPSEVEAKSGDINEAIIAKAENEEIEITEDVYEEQTETEESLSNFETTTKKHFCIQCGKPCEEGQLLCSDCQDTEAIQEELFEERMDKKKSTGIVIAIIGIIIALLLCIAGYIIIIGDFKFLNTKSSESSRFENAEDLTEDATADSSDTSDTDQEDVSTESSADTTEEAAIVTTTEETSEATDTTTEAIESTDVTEAVSVLPVTMDKIISVTATSHLSENSVSHSPNRIVDGNIQTGWAEGVIGQGIDETVTVHFGERCIITGFSINAGLQQSETWYRKNSRPSFIQVTFSDGSNELIELADVYGTQQVVLSQPVETNSISFTIKAVYSGDTYQDTVISEIYLY